MALLSSARRHRSLLHLRLFSSSPPSDAAPAAAPAAPRPSSRPTVDLAILQLIRARDFSTVESLLDRRLDSPSSSSEPHLASLILDYSAANLLDRAIAAFTASPAPRTTLSFNTLLSCCNRSRKHLRLVPSLFADLSTKHSIAPNEISYGILVKSLCRAGGAQKALPILQQMESKNINITTVTYTTILDALYKEGKPKEAEKLWQEMLTKGCTLDSAAYNVRAQQRKPDDILVVIKEMETAGMKPDIITYNYLMASYCKQDRLKEAVKVYTELGKKDCTPNTLTYQTLLAFLCKKGEFEKARQVFLDSMSRDKVPDLSTVKILVEGLVKKGKTAVAKKTVRRLSSKYPVEFTGDWKKLEKIVGLRTGEEVPEEAGALEEEQPMAV